MRARPDSYVTLSHNDISKIFRQLASIYHSDTETWDDEKFKELNNARDEALWKWWKQDASKLLKMFSQEFWEEYSKSNRPDNKIIYFSEKEVRKVIYWNWDKVQRPEYSQEIEDLLISIPNSSSILEMLKYIKDYNRIIFQNENFSFLWFLASIEAYLWAPKWFMKFYYPNIYELFFQLWRGNVDMLNWLYIVRHVLAWLYNDTTQRDLQDKHISLDKIEKWTLLEETLYKQMQIWENIWPVKKLVSRIVWEVRWIISKIK